MLVELTTGVNFINVLRTNFSNTSYFSSYILALWKNLYEKHANNVDEIDYRSKVNASKWVEGFDRSREIEVDFLPWDRSQPNGYPLQNCVTSSIKDGTTTFWDVLCDALFCFPCRFNENKIFSLRGPCTGVPNVDTKYLFIQDHAEKGVYTFQGFKGQTNIELNLTSRAWELISLVEGESILGSFHGKVSISPTFYNQLI